MYFEAGNVKNKKEKIRGGPKKLLQIRFGLLEGFIGCINFFGNRLVEYRDPTNLMDQRSNTWRLVYVGIKKEPTISGLTILWGN